MIGPPLARADLRELLSTCRSICTAHGLTTSILHMRAHSPESAFSSKLISRELINCCCKIERHLDLAARSEGSQVSCRELGTGAKRNICRVRHPDQIPGLSACQVFHAYARAHGRRRHCSAHALGIVPPAVVSTGWLAVHHFALQIAAAAIKLSDWMHAPYTAMPKNIVMPCLLSKCSHLACMTCVQK